MTHDISGHTSPAPFAVYDPDTSSWKTSQGTFPWASTECSPTWPKWGTWDDGGAYEAPMSAHLTAGNASSSLLPTPAAQEPGGTPERHLERKNRIDGADRTTVTHLSLAVQLLPTPTARLGPRGMPNRATAQRRMFEEGRRDLEDAVALLPTPTVNDSRSGRNATANRLTPPKPTTNSSSWTLTDVCAGAPTSLLSDDGKPSTDPPPDPETTEAD